MFWDLWFGYLLCLFFRYGLASPEKLCILPFVALFFPGSECVTEDSVDSVSGLLKHFRSKISKLK